MKISLAFILAVLVSISIRAQTDSALSTNQEAGVSQSQETPYVVTNRDADSKVWERTTYEKSPSGELLPRVHRYTEMATGMHYQKDGDWVESAEEIEVLPNGGAAAVQGQHQAYFPGDIYQGQIELVTPAGTRLKSRPLGLSYFDGKNSVLIAELTNSVGLVIASNQVIYPNAFVNLKADLRYTYTKAGFEQDVILREQPPTPEAFGMDSKATRLQVLTEFFDAPQPSIQSRILPKQGGLSMTDQSLGFSRMQMIPGRAFLLGEHSTGAGSRVNKTWQTMEGRQFLIEEVPLGAISSSVSTLPSAASIGKPGSHIVSQHLRLPPQHLASVSRKPMLFANNSVPPLGFVLDYQIVNSNYTNVIFQGDSTYYISGPVNLFGTNIFEGGTVLKYADFSSAGLSIWGTAPTFKTGPYRPAVFTSAQDNTVGESVNSTNSTAIVSASYLMISPDVSVSDVPAFPYLRFLYAGSALQYNFVSNPRPIKSCQFLNCGTAVQELQGNETMATAPVALDNVLFSRCDTAVYGGLDVVGENVTADQVDTFFNAFSEPHLLLTNCILTAVSSLSSIDNTLDHCMQSGSSNGVYQTVGAGSYYLAVDSTNRNAGTSNSSLLSELRQKTTYPPLVLANIFISTNINFSPHAQRDADAPDLGYHYDPIDYLVENCWITNSTLIVTNGAVVAGCNDGGLIVTDYGTIDSEGTALLPNWFTIYSCVQEQPLLIGALTTGNICINSFHVSTPPNGTFHFSRFSTLANGEYILYHNSSWAFNSLAVEDCEFWGGRNDLSGNNFSTVSLKNNLFARSPITAAALGYSTNSLSVSNNLFWNVVLTLRPFVNSNQWTFFNNTFDGVNIVAGHGIQQAISGFNGYIRSTNGLNSIGVNDVISANPIGYQSGPLGDFYQPSTSFLINTGSITADLAGLYNYTTTTNQTEEGNSTVDIGYHYVALDGNGKILDGDSDGVLDWEDGDSNDPIVGLLNITILSPAQGAILQ